MAFPSICEGEYYESEINSADIPVLQESLAQIRQLSKDKLKVTFLPNVPPELLSAYYLDLDYPFAQSCDYFWKNMKIFPDGTHSPCLNFRVGNIAEHSFADIWNGPRMQTLRLLFKQRLFTGMCPLLSALLHQRQPSCSPRPLKAPGEIMPAS